MALPDCVSSMVVVPPVDTHLPVTVWMVTAISDRDDCRALLTVTTTVRAPDEE